MRISPKKLAFTLVELLTVIAIIAVLMGLLFPAIGAAKESAKRTQAKNDCVQIVTAVKAYYTEYGKYPVTSNEDTTFSTSNADVIGQLRSVIVSGSSLNPRQIVFLEVPDAKVSGTTARSGVNSSGNWMDPWGYAYNIAIDGGYDNQLTVNVSGSSSTLYTGVASWSLGKDAKDPVCSWK